MMFSARCVYRSQVRRWRNNDVRYRREARRWRRGWWRRLTVETRRRRSPTTRNTGWFVDVLSALNVLVLCMGVIFIAIACLFFVVTSQLGHE